MELAGSYGQYFVKPGLLKRASLALELANVSWHWSVPNGQWEIEAQGPDDASPGSTIEM